jgi:hypothetical protein
MDRNVVYVSVFGVLCVLAGVLVGAGISRNAGFPCRGTEMPNFRERAERFMGYGPEETMGKKRHAKPIEVISEKLGLNPEQKAKVSEILENTRQKIDEVGKGVRSAILEIKERGDKQIMEILNPQQQEKFKEFQKEMERHFKFRRHRGGPEGEGNYIPEPEEDISPRD